MIKTQEEIQKIREACIAAKQVLQECYNYADIGINCIDIDRRASLYMQDLNVISGCFGYNKFPSQICISVNNEAVHGVAKNKKLKDGDIVKIDVVVQKNGYYGDTCRTKMIGNKHLVHKEELLKQGKICLQIGINQAKPGNKICDIGNAINKYLVDFNDKNKTSYNLTSHFTGHGIGKEMHEPPQILHCNNKNNIEIVPNMIFTIEPIIFSKRVDKFYLDIDGHTVYCKKGILSTQEEHTILITKNGNEILT